LKKLGPLLFILLSLLIFIMWRKKMVIDEAYVMSLTVVSLKKLCLQYKLTTKGMKANLRNRILEHLKLGKYDQGPKSVVMPTKQGKLNVASRTTVKTVDDVISRKKASNVGLMKTDKIAVVTTSKAFAFKKQVSVLKKVEAQRNIQLTKK